jgi:hypothetical protein
MLALVSAVRLGSESRGTHDYVLLSQIWDSPGWRAIYSPETRWPSYTPRHWAPFSSLPATRRATVEVFEPSFVRNSLIAAAAGGRRYTALAQQHLNHRVLYSCFSICCRGNVFTFPLPKYDRLYSFHYSGFQPSCHNILRVSSSNICSLVFL